MEQSDYRCKHCLHMYQLTNCSMRWCDELNREMYAESLPCQKFELHPYIKYCNGSDK